MKVELVLDAKATLGEGALWDSRQQRLLWVDIEQNEVHVFNPADDTDRVHSMGQMVGAVVPRRSGGWMLAVHHGFAFFDPESGKFSLLNDPEHHLTDNRFNDGKCDPAGRFWAGTMSLIRQPNSGSLYCMDVDCSVRQMLTEVTTSNGIVWSLDHSTMFYIDTGTHQVAAFDYDIETAEIANRRVIVEVPESDGKPDGMTIDSEGMLWVAHWNGGRVTQWNPESGSLEQTIPIPASRVTSCAFGGPNLDDLYITTARTGLGQDELAEQPHAGGLFRVRPGARGIDAYEFAG